MLTQEYDVEITFIEPLLGTVPKDKSIYAAYIGSRAPVQEDGEEEIETVPTSEERGWTGFHQSGNGDPLLYDYAMKGFFKDACSALRRVVRSKSANLKAFKKVIDGQLFVEPRAILLHLPSGERMGIIQRPLRAQTAQGERVSLVRSDACPVGTHLTFRLQILGDLPSEDLLREWLDYGRLRGLGQWRNGSWGRFIYSMRRL